MSERIVVGIDGSEQSRIALQWALDEAELRDAAVDVVRVWRLPYVGDFAGTPVAAIDPDELAEANRALLDSVVDTALATRSERTVNRIVREGGPVPVLIDQAKGASLLAVGSRGRGGFAELLLGSVSHQLASHAPCPVGIVRGERRRARQGTVVVGIDGSDASRRALQWAANEAVLREAPLHLVYAALDPLPAGAYEITVADEPHFEPSLVVSEALEVVASMDKAPDTHTHIVDDDAVKALLHHANDASLLVVSSRGRGGFASLLLGSVSHHVAVHAPCPVVIVR